MTTTERTARELSVSMSEAARVSAEKACDRDAYAAFLSAKAKYEEYCRAHKVMMYATYDED